MRLRVYGAFLFVSLALSSFVPTYGAEAAKPSGLLAPTINSNGNIISGTKSIWHKTSYAQLNVRLDNDAIGQFFEILDLGKGAINPVSFLDPESQVLKNGASYTAAARESTSSEEKLGTYKLSMTLQDDGLILVEAICKLKDESLLKDRYATLDLPPYLQLAGKYVHGGVTKDIVAKTSVTFRSEELKGARITFFGNDPGKSFSILPVSLSELQVNGSRLSFRAGDKVRLAFLLDLRVPASEASKEKIARNGIGLESIDGLTLPDLDGRRNLIQNPSFEAGFRYWSFPNYVHSVIPLKYTNVFEIDNTVARTGQRSLRMKALPVRYPTSLGPFTIPFNPGEKCVYSFYARSSAESGTVIHVWGRGPTQQLFPDNVKTFKVGKEWQRISIPFDAKDRFSSIFFDAASDDGTEDKTVWVDDVQLEQGTLTEFERAPVDAELVSAARGNFLKFGDAPAFRLNVCTMPNAAGTASVAVKDFFSKKIFEKDYSFRTDAQGRATVAMDDLSSKVSNDQTRGVMVAAITFKVDRLAKPVQDFFRFSVMNFLDNTQKNKNLFNLTYVYSHQSGGPHMERSLERERAIGFGSICYDFVKFANDLDYDLDRERVELCERYGFEFMGRPVLKLHDGVGGEITEKQGAVVMQNIKTRINPTDAELKEFEDIVALKAKNRPWNKIWWFTGESNPGVMPLESNPDAFAKFLLATYRGVKRGNPRAKVLVEGGPWTMETQYGAAWTERYIKDTHRLDPSIRFDGAAAHHYRDFPESPDLDNDISEFLKMLDRNGCSDWPFYVNEGGNYSPINIPQEGMSPYIQHSANSWYIPPLSYDVGRAEKISAAFSARNWLIGLKYANRVACMQDFNTPNRYVDYDFTPRPYEKVPNTLGRLLGNATFYKDIRFAANSRCYVFKDDKTGAAIAAVWGHKESVDRWKEEAPVYAFDLRGLKVKCLDLMESETSFPTGPDGRTLIPASPFPIFLTVDRGNEVALCTAIEGASPVSAAADAPVQVNAYPEKDGRIALAWKNSVKERFSGKADVKLNGVEQQLNVAVPSLGEAVTYLTKTGPLTYGTLQPFNLVCSIGTAQPTVLKGSYVMLRPNTSATASPQPLKNLKLAIGDDFSANVTLANDALRIELRSKQSGPAESIYAGTGIYIDPFGKKEDWTRPRSARQDLAVFELVKDEKGALAAYCHFVQGTQAGSGGDLVSGRIQKRITIVTIPDAGGSGILITIPRDVLTPINFIAGSRFGMNITAPAGAGSEAKSLVPVKGFTKVAEPGEVDLAAFVVGIPGK